MSPNRLSWIFHVDSVPMTKAVVAGETSLGGSESACLGLARALRARGHDVTIVATRLAPDVPQVDHAGVKWFPAETVDQVVTLTDPDVFVALRQPMVFGKNIQARWRMLWNQDMYVAPANPGQDPVMAFAWAYDELTYVSQYHRKQWEGVRPELAPLGWVTKNGFDPAMVPTDVTRVPNRIIHISRPERAMGPLLAMWPELKKRVPDAELHVCRYQSMYDGEGSHVKAMVEAYDREIARVNSEVGGIVQLGQLNKRDLYRALASASVMWYPGVVDFAETSCIAAIEAQACGTPLVLSYKGALPETAPSASFIRGDAMSPEYQTQSVEAVYQLLKMGTGRHLASVDGGIKHVQSYTYDAIAAEWEAHIWAKFDARSAAAPARVVEALLHEDDHVAAHRLSTDPEIVAECERVMRGEAHTAEQYGEHALDPEEEMTTRKQQRHLAVIEAFAGKKRILDLACGNGAFAILLAEDDPDRRVTGYDYSAANIRVAHEAALRHGVSDRVTFHQQTVCDLESGAVTPDVQRSTYDGVFVGEFCEHVAGVERFISDVHTLVGPGVSVVITVPSGPFADMLGIDMVKQKGHVHHFRPRDIEAIWGAQQDFTVDYLDCGRSPRGPALGHWIIRYTTSDTPVGQRPLSHWHRAIRPKTRMSVGILAHNASHILSKCLDTVWQIADEILIANCGSGDVDELRHVAERHKASLLHLPKVHELEGGFAQARNITLDAASGEWFLWIDTDETLIGNGGLRKYLESGIFRGYALFQNHLMLDAPRGADTPVRLFKRGPDIEFYGCVHEQPQMSDCNGDIVPALQLQDVQIVHDGYLHEGIRDHKAKHRNRPLLVRDQQVFPDRELGKVLWVREFALMGTEAATKAGRATPEATQCWSQAVELFEARFMDPANKFHAIARPFYEQAVRHISGALEVETALGGRAQGLGQAHAEPTRFWVRRPEHIKPLVDFHQKKALAVFEPGPPLDVAPYEPAKELVTA